MQSENPQFDVNLGGSVELPLEFNMMKFAAARANEIRELSNAKGDSGKVALIFQRLPRQMRRRVMSHNSKRLPRQLRLAHQNQLNVPGTQTVRKRPSRKFRRRPTNLLAEYNRRQRKYVWLETHVWHAKRFHMTEQWGYRLPLHPNDRSYRACYRAAANHCLLQDVSFLCCIEVAGPLNYLLSGLNKHTNPACGLTFAAKSFLDGSREGELMFFESELYPQKAIGTISFLWKPVDHETDSHSIWIWVHPSCHKQIVDALISTFELENVGQCSEAIVPQCTLDKVENEDSVGDSSPPLKRRKIRGIVKNVEEIKLANRNVPFERTPKFKSKSGSIAMTLLKDTLNRFRLTGPLSQAVLQEALPLASSYQKSMKEQPACSIPAVQGKSKTPVPVSMDIDAIFSALPDQSLRNEKENVVLSPSPAINTAPSTFQPVSEIKSAPVICKRANKTTHNNYWKSLEGILSPAQLPPHMVLSLLVSDPRLFIPDKRSKALPNTSAPYTDIQKLACTPPSCSSSIWSPSIRDYVTRSKLSTAEINNLRSKLLVPGLLRTTNGPQNPDLSAFGSAAEVEIPLLLIQRPGSQDSSTKRIGFGCGWDVVLPAGWAMPLWLALIFRCAKPAGLREASSHMLESSGCDILPPDTQAGCDEEERKGNKLKEIYFRLPPSKRSNYMKLGVACPFQCNWAHLLRDWALGTSDVSLPTTNNFSVPNFFVLRERKLLKMLADVLHTIWRDLKHNKGFDYISASKMLECVFSLIPNQDYCLLPVNVEALRRGVTDSLSMICIPSINDVSGNTIDDPVEELHEDKQQAERKKVRKEHKALLVRLRRQRVRAKRIQEKIEVLQNKENFNKSIPKKKQKKSPTEQLVLSCKKKMEEMWLPNSAEKGSIKFSGSRKTAGFITKGDFSFTEAKGSGVGYIAIQSLPDLVKLWLTSCSSHILKKLKSDSFVVLIRSPTSLKYRLAKLSIIVR